MEKFLDVNGVADRLDIKPSTVKRWVASGKIPGIYISPKILRFDWAEVVKAIKRFENVRSDIDA